jgi:hypothetical protein
MHVALYLLLSYMAVAIVTRAYLLPRTRRAGISRWKTGLIIMGLLLLPLLPYAVVEGQTLLLRPSVWAATQHALRQGGFSDRLFLLKVLSVGPKRVRVYTVTPCMPYDTNTTQWRAVVVRLARTADGWQPAGEEHIWSECGSASGNVFPPYPGKGEH